jgi:hypothetical protein
MGSKQQRPSAKPKRHSSFTSVRAKQIRRTTSHTIKRHERETQSRRLVERQARDR